MLRSYLVLTENAIKHNALTTERPLQIQIACSDDGHIFVKNNKQAKSITEPSSFTGLKNLSERYKMISGSTIEVIDDDQYFMVKIKAFKK